MRLFLWIAGMAAGAVWMLSLSGSPAFEPYFGTLPPVPVVVVISLVAALFLGLLFRRAWTPNDLPRGRGFGALALLACVFAIPVVAVDLLGGFPEEINVRAPASLLFYPAIAFVAESVFHVIPLGVAATITGPSGPPRRVRLIGVVLLIATLEPILQVAWGAGGSPTWANGYVGVHVFAFNLIGLWWFFRSGFLAMYLFRVVYYLTWHVAWGVLRLDLLF